MDLDGLTGGLVLWWFKDIKIKVLKKENRFIENVLELDGVSIEV